MLKNVHYCKELQNNNTCWQKDMLKYTNTAILWTKLSIKLIRNFEEKPHLKPYYWNFSQEKAK